MEKQAIKMKKDNQVVGVGHVFLNNSKGRIHSSRSKIYGLLEVTILRACGLPSKSNSYVVIKKHDTVLWQSSSDFNTQDPFWNQTMKIYIRECDKNSSLNIEVWSCSKFTKDELIGGVVLYLHSVNFKKQVMVEPIMKHKKFNGVLQLSTTVKSRIEVETEFWSNLEERFGATMTMYVDEEEFLDFLVKSFPNSSSHSLNAMRELYFKGFSCSETAEMRAQTFSKFMVENRAVTRLQPNPDLVFQVMERVGLGKDVYNVLSEINNLTVHFAMKKFGVRNPDKLAASSSR
ncbi:hypothetical protein AKO1_001616 [Acrasis kona]|uniref:C2 domain-containing protein n=1 Tax=Acrasis kona TaxID=1008807 RepID=A0AAW2ZBP5_9EUKA